MGEIKSAAEIAREKLAGIGEATPEERLTWKYQPEGEKLAARYLKDNINLAGEIGKYDKEARRFVSRGASDIFIRNISLPRNDAARRNNTRAMDRLKVIKHDKAALENVFSRLRRVLDHYTQQGEQQKQQAYQSLKAEFEAKVQQAIKQQMGVNAQMQIDVEKQPQFQQEWLRLQSQLDGQYSRLIDEYKQELMVIE